jgi:nitrogen fixation protein FixH
MKFVIVIIVFLGIASVVTVIYVGNRTFEGIVVEHPYEKGLAWDKARKDKSAVGWVVDLSNEQFRKGDNELTLSVRDRDGRPLRDVEVAVIVSRPSTTKYDRRYETVGSTDGLYHALVSLPLYGQWDVTAEVSRREKSIDFDYRIFAEKEGS